MANTVAELVVIPVPGLGHIMSTIAFAKLLVKRDQRLSITVLIIKPSGEGTGSAITTFIESLSSKAMDRISFIELPQEETRPMIDPKSPMNSLKGFINSHSKYVTDIVADVIGQPSSGKLLGFVVDVFCIDMMNVANKFKVPTYVYFTSNAAFLGFKLYIQTLCDDQGRDVIRLSNSDTMILVPSFVKPVPTNVFPYFVQTREGLDFFLWFARKMKEVKAILVNTFLELETHAIQSLSADISIAPVYAVGPILNLEGSAGTGKPFDNDVISWLDSQPPSSVVFLCFGSMGSFEETQVKEIAYALEKSGHHFVWSLRQPPLREHTSRATGDFEDQEAVLPEGFMERTAERGKVIGWAPQVTLLAHSAVGGFVSHCGWNSLLESLWFGVPSATWPIYAEQQMNAFQMVKELGLAVEIKLDYKKNVFNPKADAVIVTAEEIESGIRRLMADDNVRTKVKEISEKSRAAVAEGGSSYASVGGLIHDIMRNVS